MISDLCWCCVIACDDDYELRSIVIILNSLYECIYHPVTFLELLLLDVVVFVVSCIVCAFDMHEAEVVLVRLEKFGSLLRFPVQIGVIVSIRSLGLYQWYLKCDANTPDYGSWADHERIDAVQFLETLYLQPLSTTPEGYVVRVS